MSKRLNNENAYAILEAGETYRFAGYSWTACELVNDGRVAVIQSHGVTHGAWPGFVMSQFGNGNYYSKSIDGDDISAYDDKMQALYDAIKDVEDTSASYGKGLYLIPKEKAGFTEWGKSGSGNYWAALKALAENARSFGAASDHAWLGTVYGSYGAWYVYSGGNVYDGDQSHDFVVAPAFNLDLSKVEIIGDEIIKKAQPAYSPFELLLPVGNLPESNTLLCVMKSKTGLQMTPEMPNTELANMYLERDLTRQKPGLSKVCLLQTMNRVPWNILKHFHPNRKHGIKLNHLSLQTRMETKLRRLNMTGMHARLQ